MSHYQNLAYRCMTFVGVSLITSVFSSLHRNEFKFLESLNKELRDLAPHIKTFSERLENAKKKFSSDLKKLRYKAIVFLVPCFLVDLSIHALIFSVQVFRYFKPPSSLLLHNKNPVSKLFLKLIDCAFPLICFFLSKKLFSEKMEKCVIKGSKNNEELNNIKDIYITEKIAVENTPLGR